MNALLEEELEKLLKAQEEAIKATATIKEYLDLYPGGVDKEVLDAWQVVYEWMTDTGE